MSKKSYWFFVVLMVTFISALFFASIPALGRLFNIESSHILAYSFLIIGISVFYFGFFCPHWFIKEIIPSMNSVKFKVSNKSSMKPSLRDDSFFWNLFPYALFFTFGGLAYLLYPSPYSLIVALVCSAWVKLLYKLV